MSHLHNFNGVKVWRFDEVIGNHIFLAATLTSVRDPTRVVKKGKYARHLKS